MKIIKPIIYFILSLVLLVIIAVVSLFTFVNPNNYKGYITQTLSQKTKSNVMINGNIKWSIYPEVSFRLEEINLDRTIDNSSLELKTNYLKLSISFLKSIKNFELSFDNIFIDNPVLNIYEDKIIAKPVPDLLAKKNGNISIAGTNKNLGRNIYKTNNNIQVNTNKGNANNNEIKSVAARININKIFINNAEVNYYKAKRHYSLAKFSTEIVVDTESFANVVIISTKPDKLELLERPAILDLHLKLNDNRKAKRNIVIQSLDLSFNIQDLKFNVLSGLLSDNYVSGLLGINFNLTTTFQKFEWPNIIRGLNGKFNIILNDTNLEKLEKLDYLADIIDLFENIFNQKETLSSSKVNKAKEVLDLLSQNRLFKRRLKIKTIDDTDNNEVISSGALSTDIKTTGVVKQGIIQNNILLINKVYTIEGQGRFNLNNNYIKYNITALKTEKQEKKDKTVIPLILYGNIRKPEIKLDVKRTIDNNKLFEKALKLLSGD